MSHMRTHCFRLRRGDDLRQSLERYVREQHIRAAVVLSAVGCVSRAVLRDASGVTVHTLEGRLRHGNSFWRTYQTIDIRFLSISNPTVQSIHRFIKLNNKIITE